MASRKIKSEKHKQRRLPKSLVAASCALTLTVQCLALSCSAQVPNNQTQSKTQDSQSLSSAPASPSSSNSSNAANATAGSAAANANNQNSDLQRPNSGEATRPTDMTADQLRQSRNLINAEDEHYRQRFLRPESIELSLPKANQLMPLGGKLPPIKLEASFTEPISLREALVYSLENNLPIRINTALQESAKWLLVGACGGFLPNALMNYQDQYLQGSTFIGGVIPTTFHTPNVQTSAGFQYYVFQGGAVVFNTLSKLHSYRAAKKQLQASVNDQLLAVTQSYYTLVQNQALLQIQTRAVEVSRAQLMLNNQLEAAGTGTKFQVLQAETQLASDEQNLLTQEVNLRSAAIALTQSMNANYAVNLMAVETEVKKVRLLDPNLDIEQLVNLAVLHRPELKQYEELRIAARRNIQLAAAPLYPQMQFYGSIAGNGPTLTKTYGLTQPSVSSFPVNNGMPLTGSAILTPGGGVGLRSANNALANGTAYQTATIINPPALVDRQIRPSYTIGYNIAWNYPGLGVPTMSSVMSNRALARQAMLNANQQVLNVLSQVRNSYLASEVAERQIEVAAKQVVSSMEELRLARVRLANGVGTNIDVINAQRDFTTGLVNKATAIIRFNIAQAQLVHDIGMISLDAITSGRLVKAEIETKKP